MRIRGTIDTCDGLFFEKLALKNVRRYLSIWSCLIGTPQKVPVFASAWALALWENLHLGMYLNININ